MRVKSLSKIQASRYQKAATNRPQLYSWGARSLYIGPSLNLSAHRNAVAVVAIGLDGKFALAHDPRHPERGSKGSRCALIPPNTLHHLSAPRGRMAFLYVDAVSRDLSVLDAAVRERTKRAGFHLACENLLIDLLLALADHRADFSSIKDELQNAVLGGNSPDIHPKLLPAIRHLNSHAAERPSLADLAGMAALSPSRFRHAFREITGVPLRRYRVWAAMGAAMRSLASGKSLTDAAQDAGFSSSAHFSFAFREMFGLEPSRLTRAGLQRSALPSTRSSVSRTGMRRR